MQNSAQLNWQNTTFIRSFISYNRGALCCPFLERKYLEFIFNLVLILAKRSAELSLLYIQRPIFELLTADKDEIKNNFDFVEQLFYSWNIKYSKDEAP